MFDDDAQPTEPSKPSVQQQPQPQAVAATAPDATAESGLVPDMFDETEHEEHDESMNTDLSPETTVAGPSALHAGKLTPISDAAQVPPPSDFLPPSASSTMESDLEKNPGHGTKIFIALGIVIVITVITCGVWWFVGRSAEPTAPAAALAPVAEKGDSVNIDVTASPGQAAPAAPSTAPTNPSPAAESEQLAPPTSPSAPAPSAAPKPEIDTTKDTDKDGLPDAKEAELNTNPANPDSDEDGLTDGAEVNIWGTNPLKKDSDGDGFSDGQEVMNGFNPKGPGKLQ